MKGKTNNYYLGTYALGIYNLIENTGNDDLLVLADNPTELAQMMGKTAGSIKSVITHNKNKKFKTIVYKGRVCELAFIKMA